MDFAYSDKVKAMQAQLNALMGEHAYGQIKTKLRVRKYAPRQRAHDRRGRVA